MCYRIREKYWLPKGFLPPFSLLSRLMFFGFVIGMAPRSVSWCLVHYCCVKGESFTVLSEIVSQGGSHSSDRYHTPCLPANDQFGVSS